LITHEISLCIGANKHDKVVSVKCHDTGVNLRVHLFAHRRKTWRTEEVPYVIPAGATAVLKVAKPDKTKVLIDGEVQGGSIFFAHRPETFTAAGVSQAEVSLYDIAGRRLTTASFEIDVTKECICDCDKESEPYVDIVAKQIGAAIDAEKNAGEHANTAESAAKRAEDAAKKAKEEAERAGAAPDAKNVSYAEQSLTETEQTQARQNIGAAATGDIPTMDVVESGDGYRIHITDANGTKSVFVRNGSSGDIFASKYKSTSFEEITKAIDGGKPACVVLPNGKTMWVKHKYSVADLSLWRFADDEGYVDVREAASWEDGVLKIAGQSLKCTSVEKTPGEYIFHAGITFRGSNDGPDDGLYILPVNDTTNPEVGVDPDTGRRYKYKVRLSLQDGVQLIYNSVSNGDYSGVLAGKNASGSKDTLPAKLSAYTPYNINIAKTNGALAIKVWKTSEPEPDWQCFYEDRTLRSIGDDGTQYENGFEFHWTAKEYTGSVMLEDVRFAADLYEWTNMLSNVDASFYDKSGRLGFYGLSSMSCNDGKLTMRNAGSSFATNDLLSGDYTAQIDFKLGGASTDDGGTDRDEGLYIFPLYETTNKNIERWKHYRVRLSNSHGVSLHYGYNANGDYGDVLAGMENTTNNGDHDMPATLKKDVLYSCKIKKQYDGLYIKVWEKGTKEPDWQCEYHADSICSHDNDGEIEKWRFLVAFTNKGSDAEYVTISDLSLEGWNATFWDGCLESRPNADALFAREGMDWGDYTPINDAGMMADYFDIDDAGMLSLKRCYRGRGPTAGKGFDYAISDNDSGVAGSKNEELPQHIVIPEVVNEIAVRSLAPGMFMKNARVVSIKFPASLTELPDRVCDMAPNLRHISGTENVTKIGDYAFQRTGIDTAYFPSLKEIGKACFVLCYFLTTAELGGEITKIPTKTFDTCEKLSRVTGVDKVTYIGEAAFNKTFRLRHLDCLSNITGLEKNAFCRSRVIFDWYGKTGVSPLGDYANAKKLNPTNIFYDATTGDVTPLQTITEYVDNELLSCLNQNDPAFKDKPIGKSTVTITDSAGKKIPLTYENGCMSICAAMAYSSMEKVRFTSPEEFVALVGEIDEDLIAKNPTHLGTMKAWFEALGYEVTGPKSYVSGEANSLQELYDALGRGDMVLSFVGSPGTYGHINLFYGIKASGEILAYEPDSAQYNLGVNEGQKYMSLVQNNVHTGSATYLIIKKKA
jgi:hypothetical protein